MVSKKPVSSITNLSEEGLFRKYYPRLCNFALSYVSDEDLAEDLVQDAFVTFLESKNTLENVEDTLKAYLYTCVKFACLNHLRHMKVRQRANLVIDLNPVDDPKFLERIIHAEVMGKIHQAIEELPKGCSMVFKAGYLEGLSNRDLAEKLGVSINTIKSQKQRGLTLLRRKLSPEVFSMLLVIFP